MADVVIAVPAHAVTHASLPLAIILQERVPSDELLPPYPGSIERPPSYQPRYVCGRFTAYDIICLAILVIIITVMTAWIFVVGGHSVNIINPSFHVGTEGVDHGFR